jgi:hypothetical protein
MRLAFSHPWDLPVGEAKALQWDLAQKVLARPGTGGFCSR